MYVFRGSLASSETESRHSAGILLHMGPRVGEVMSHERFEQGRVAGEGVERGTRVIGLRPHPALHLRVVEILHPTIVIDDFGSEVVIGDRYVLVACTD